MKTNDLIKQVHKDFYYEVDVLLEKTKNTKSLKSTDDEKMRKGKRLRKLGFKSSKEANELGTVESQNRKAQEINKDKQELAEAINYFTTKYSYKFITEESVKKICKKYGLVYGSVDRYIGEVPDKNLEQLENFSIDKRDKLYYVDIQMLNHYINDAKTYYINFKEYKKHKERSEIYEKIKPTCIERIMGLGEVTMEIAASQNDFDMTNMEVNDYKLTQKPIPDPVVLQPVIYKGNKYYLIVTAWGDEATDPSTFNEKNN